MYMIMCCAVAPIVTYCYGGALRLCEIQREVTDIDIGLPRYELRGKETHWTYFNVILREQKGGVILQFTVFAGRVHHIFSSQNTESSASQKIFRSVTLVSELHFDLTTGRTTATCKPFKTRKLLTPTHFSVLFLSKTSRWSLITAGCAPNGISD